MSGSGVGPRLDIQPPAEAALGPSLSQRAEFSRRVRLVALAIVITAGCLVTALLYARSFTSGPPGLRFWLVAALIAAGQVARVRNRVGTGYMMVGWGELASMTALCLLPPVWLPLAAAVGITVTHIEGIIAPSGPKSRGPYRICTLIVASFAAAAVAAIYTGSPAIQLRPNTVASLAVLVLAGAAYFLAAQVFAVAWFVDAKGLSAAWRATARCKRFVAPGNLAVGTAVAIVLDIDPRWLVALLPVVVILHKAYVYQARVDDGSLWWSSLVAATRGLAHPEAIDVIGAAQRGARRLFGSDDVNVAVRGDLVGASPNQAVRWYASNGLDQVEEPISGPDVISRPLVVDQTPLGEIRVRLDRVARTDPAVDLVFSTFAFAVANALSDAETQHDLEAVTARGAFDAVHDRLTGLNNRSTLVARGDAELTRRCVGAAAALVLLDVDAFRAVNDTLSPVAGDELLRVIATRLRQTVGDGEILARLGGDEFAMFLAEDCAAAEAANQRATELSALVAAPVDLAGVTIGVTATIGVGLGQIGAACDVDTDELMRRAGAALRQARACGAALARYGGAPTSGALRGDVLADLRDALATTNQLAVVIQPVVSLATLRPVGAEVLVRWQHPLRGLLLPSDFLDVVERSELALEFTRHVIDLALGIAAAWSLEGINLPVTVNLGARCTLDPQLPKMVADRLAAHGVQPRRLILEITEGVMVADPDQVKQAVAAVRDLGVQVSVGDFGTASASLDLLARCRVDEVKIDRTFVAAMTTSPETAAIVAATVDIARALGIRVVAEAVERPEQRDALIGLRVTQAQGHLFYPPLSAVDIPTLLNGTTV
jgi:diguanylate cyclase (GGDEF)-like protein